MVSAVQFGWCHSWSKRNQQESRWYQTWKCFHKLWRTGKDRLALLLPQWKQKLQEVHWSVSDSFGPWGYGQVTIGSQWQLREQFVRNFLHWIDSDCCRNSWEPIRNLRLEDVYFQPGSSHWFDQQMEKLKTLLRNFQKYRQQSCPIPPRGQTFSRRTLEMDWEIRAKHQVKREVLDNIGASADREGSGWVEKIHKQHSDNKPASNLRAFKGSACMSEQKADKTPDLHRNLSIIEYF